MKEPAEYKSILDEHQEFLATHNQLLQSLLLSKQNAADNSYTEETNGDADGTQYPGEGVSESSNEQHLRDALAFAARVGA
jgi:hypothetical protein